MNKIRIILGRLKDISLARLKNTIKGVRKQKNIPGIFILLDMVYCYLKYGTGYFDYYNFGFVNLNAAKRSTYMTMLDNNALVLRLDDQEKRKLFEDKIEFLRTFGDYLGREWIDLRESGKEGFREFVTRHPVFFAKSPGGFGGLEVRKIKTDGESDLDRLFDELSSVGMWCIEEPIIQHAEMDKLCPDCVNTQRPFRDLNGIGLERPESLCAPGSFCVCRKMPDIRGDQACVNIILYERRFIHLAEYEIKDTDIEESMRRIGTAFRRIRPYQDEEFFRKTNMAEDKLIKGKWAPVHTDAEERFIPRGDGSELRVLICRAKNVEKRKSGAAGLLWIHGGGYATGVPEQDHLFADIFCTEGECVAVMPDYTRSTEAPYPAALSDCCLALYWMVENADELDIDRNRIMVGGDSAGGGLAAAVCLRSRDEGIVHIAFQMPLYPMLDDRETETSKNNDAPVWNTRSNRAGWDLYLAGYPKDGDVPSYAALESAQGRIMKVNEDLDKLIGVRTRQIQRRLKDVSTLPSAGPQNHITETPEKD